jgi:O-antigen biosynthesis protein
MRDALRRLLRRSPPLRSAAWVNGSVLILAGRFRRIEAGDVEATASWGDRRVSAVGRCFARGRRDRFIVLGFAAGEALPGSPPALELRSNGRSTSIDPRALERARGGLDAVLPQLAALGPQTREALREQILSLAMPHLDGGSGFSLGKDLHAIREALRAPLPRGEYERDETRVLWVDKLFALDDRAFLIEGWTLDQDGTCDRLTALSPEGQEAHLDDVFRLTRPDVIEQLESSALDHPQHGFVKYFELPAPSRLESGWLLQWRDPAGGGVEVEAPAAVREAAVAQQFLLERFIKDQPDREELRREQLHPALSRLQDRHRSSTGIESVADYGTPPASPAVSIVITLYRRIDFVTHQILHFAQDPAMRDVELIYVLDSPEDAEELHALAGQVHALHGVPFRIARLSQNAGFPVANILGASLARGRMLLLLNCDVLPDRPGWLPKMVDFYDSQPDIGALGPKLLFQDESIQHAGLYFEREVDSGLWGNLHYYKGLHRHFPPASVSRPVPALTGACFMIDRALYEDAGGLHHEYILQGGYEDSDLCLRLIESGRRNWYLADAELYHLEGQAHAKESRATTVDYNTWLHTQRWGDLIERLMSETPPVATPALAAPDQTS